ncbi:hypothetical protein V1498_13240 [Peribacillus sp. SCS-26]|uniref:hypothetical protein n=1 Tax=Paraperibacillus marinus TaxID=3115295 RepID=UPI003906579F
MAKRVKGITYTTGKTKINNDPNTVRSFKINLAHGRKKGFKNSRKRHVSEMEEVITGWLGGIFILLPLALFLIYCFPRFFLPIIFMLILSVIVTKIGKHIKNTDKLKGKEKNLKEHGNSFNDKMIHFVRDSDTEAVKTQLEERGYGGNFMSGTGETALEIAIHNKNKFIIAYLIKFGALPQLRDLTAAAKSEDPEIIEMIKTGNHQRIIRRYELLDKKSI